MYDTDVFMHRESSPWLKQYSPRSLQQCCSRRLLYHRLLSIVIEAAMDTEEDGTAEVGMGETEPLLVSVLGSVSLAGL
jgi:hypothetical protein